MTGERSTAPNSRRPSEGWVHSASNSEPVLSRHPGLDPGSLCLARADDEVRSLIKSGMKDAVKPAHPHFHGARGDARGDALPLAIAHLFLGA
jgi:hypothetical protein